MDLVLYFKMETSNITVFNTQKVGAESIFIVNIYMKITEECYKYFSSTQFNLHGHMRHINCTHCFQK